MIHILVESSDLGDQLFLGGEVRLLYALLRHHVLVLLIEEIVASRDKTFPDGVRMLASHRPDLLPLFLEGDHLIGRLFPIGAVFQGFSLLTQRPFRL